MDADPTVWSFNTALGVLLVDILLSGDNAIVIALVSRTLDKKHRMKALWLGIVGAFAARLFLTSITSFAMEIPLVKLVGGFLLLKISINLIVDNSDQDSSVQKGHSSSRVDVFSAVKTIVLADVVMSLDNVLALSAVTQNNFQMLMVDDPIFGGAIVNPSSLASLVVPILAAAYTVMQSKIILRNQQSLGARMPPRSLWKIFRPTLSSAGPVHQVVPPDAISVNQSELPAVVSQVTDDVALMQEPQQAFEVLPGSTSVEVTSVVERGISQKIYIGFVFVLSGALLIGWIVHFFGKSPVMPAPENWINYQCKSPDLAISYDAGAAEMRLTSAKGVVRTNVTAADGHINWKNYQAAGFALGVMPPVKVVSAGGVKLVVDGGAFENAECIAVQK